MGDLVDRNKTQDKKNLLACEDEADDCAKIACPEANGEELIGLSTRKPWSYIWLAVHASHPDSSTFKRFFNAWSSSI